MSRPDAILLDVGGIFFIPSHDRILGAFARAEFFPSADLVDAAHFHGAARLAVDVVNVDWNDYLDAYITACGAPDDRRADIHQHLDSEFADAALWLREIPGARDGLRALEATGVKLGIVSNADGLIGQRLAVHEILQVGPGMGVDVGCVIDSGAVGVAKPDPRIFQLALDALDVKADATWYVGDTPAIDVVGARAAGLRPFIVDPCGLHGDADYERVAALSDLATRVNNS